MEAATKYVFGSGKSGRLFGRGKAGIFEHWANLSGKRPAVSL
jgi:hypothetical protein